MIYFLKQCVFNHLVYGCTVKTLGWNQFTKLGNNKGVFSSVLLVLLVSEPKKKIMHLVLVHLTFTRSIHFNTKPKDANQKALGHGHNLNGCIS